jgi:hypothetical protein
MNWTINRIKNNWFEIVAAIVLFVGMGRHPYGYYEFLHWAASAAAFYAAYRSHHTKHSTWTLIFSIIGVLFNPIIPFYLAQSTWQRWDLIAGAIFIVGAIFEKTPMRDNGNGKENFSDLGIIEQKEQKSTAISSTTTETNHQMKNVTAQNLGKAYQIIGATAQAKQAQAESMKATAAIRKTDSRSLGEKLVELDEKYPLVPHTGAGRIFSTVRRMKAEKEMDIPIGSRSGFAISTKTGRAANNMDEQEWEDFYKSLFEQLKKEYPDLYKNLYSSGSVIDLSSYPL